MSVETESRDELAQLLDGHAEDIVEIYNPDIGCEDIDTTEGWNHSKFFQVRYGGHPFQIAPGKSMQVLRYIGLHITKHLADHLLMKMEVETGRQGLVNSPIERPAMIKRIFLGVTTPYGVGVYGNEPKTQDERAIAVTESVNDATVEPSGESAGVALNPALGTLKPEPPQKEDILANVEDEEEPEGQTSIYDPSKPLPTRKKLLEECMALNIHVTGKETKEMLVSKLKSFGGR